MIGGFFELDQKEGAGGGESPTFNSTSALAEAPSSSVTVSVTV